MDEREESKHTFLHCEKCGKRLLERLSNGLFKFMFGKQKDSDLPPPVELYIHGSIKMRCWACSHFTIFDYFPKNITTNQL